MCFPLQFVGNAWSNNIYGHRSVHEMCLRSFQIKFMLRTLTTSIGPKPWVQQCVGRGCSSEDRTLFIQTNCRDTWTGLLLPSAVATDCIVLANTRMIFMRRLRFSVSLFQMLQTVLLIHHVWELLKTIKIQNAMQLFPKHVWQTAM